jgi:hypothetical protein
MQMILETTSYNPRAHRTPNQIVTYNMADEEQEPQEGPTYEVLQERASELFVIKRDLAEVTGQAAVLRKRLKGAEKALVNGMLMNNLEELEFEGRHISRTRGLKCED